MVPWLNAAANLLLDAGERSAVWEQSRLLVALNYAALTCALAVALVGAPRIARRAEELQATAARVFTSTPNTLLPGANNSTLPLLATTGTALAFAVSALIEHGWVAAVIRGATWVAVGIPMWTFLATYASLQLGLTRLGRAHLREHVSVLDPSLELRPFGAAAFTALWLLLLAIVPVLVTGFPDVVGAALGLAVLFAGVGAFVLSLWGLHREIREVKESQLELARRLYAEAYEPVREAGTLDALERQHSPLGAADALEKRARAIHDWPVPEGTWAWVIGIVTSVVAIACARLLLRPLGF